MTRWEDRKSVIRTRKSKMKGGARPGLQGDLDPRWGRLLGCPGHIPAPAEVRPLNRGPRGLKGTQGPPWPEEPWQLWRVGGPPAKCGLEGRGCAGVCWAGAWPCVPAVGTLLSFIPDCITRPGKAPGSQGASYLHFTPWGQWTRLRKEGHDSVCSKAISWGHAGIQQQW